MRRRKVMTLIAVICVTAAACGGGSDQTLTESQLENALDDSLVPEVNGVVCPDDVELAVEERFVCEATVADQYFEAEVTIVDSTGRFVYEPRHAVLDVVETEAAIGQSSTVDLGFAVTADCGDSEYLVVAVKNLFSCTLTNESGTSVPIEVEVLTAEGEIDPKPPRAAS